MSTFGLKKCNCNSFSNSRSLLPINLFRFRFVGFVTLASCAGFFVKPQNRYRFCPQPRVLVDILPSHCPSPVSSCVSSPVRGSSASEADSKCFSTRVTHRPGFAMRTNGRATSCAIFIPLVFGEAHGGRLSASSPARGCELRLHYRLP